MDTTKRVLVVKGIFSPLLIVLALSYSSLSWASVWSFVPSLSAGLTYTDNVELSNNDTDDDLVLDVRPGFSFSKREGRVNVSGQYSLQRTQHFSDSDRNDTFHQLSSGMRAELIRNNFFLNGSVRVNQTLIDTGRGGSSDNISGTDNITTFVSYELEPVFETDIGDNAALRARYQFGEVLYDSSVDKDDASDSSQHAYGVVLSSNNRPRDFTWALGVNEQRTVYDSRSDQKITTYTTNAGYSLTRRFQVNGSYGYQKQDNDQDNLRDNPDGSFWNVGIGWNPSDVTQISADYGDRYYGDSYGLSVFQRHKRNVFTLRYREEQTDTRDQLAATGDGFICPTNGPASDCRRVDPSIPIDLQIGPDEGLFGNNSPVASVNDDIFVGKTWELGYIYSFRKSEVSLNGYRQKRDYQTVLGSETTLGLSGNYRLNHNERMRSSLRFSYVKDELLDELDNKTYSTRYIYSRSLDQDTTADISLAYRKRTSNENDSEYTENRISIGFLRYF
ncbi:TIGR03016 family PEP-CTERM system-associated outer membrane protein [Aestuariirhabdus sp. Z084]|uniref:TIGR03016 family PEP-CTERM system-associated outer membrane protein n=1 Tax=Aestuariirhabdus haliotis TaxID=2918751 RepID=UPI00201B37E3|nr:TIGR03016 family PEP-CTERM system-associated outer membrane protein [Aestuariirhabdus haliotis]MCL6414676.1 TIGR03016 family PEP-CTERM system-associated outer membrane protein [Aestuariirhabdus haliotis]MCL6418608.1 TIGR03016 family PEP-CTERM system-associated outer membrane protein [Aestuariirhabdus haliotis]